MRSNFDVAVVGGGPAGLTTALYTTRLGHDTVLVDRGGGRAAMMLDTHNVIGIPESVSGNEFLETALEQLEGYGTAVVRDFVTSAKRTGDGGSREMPEQSGDRQFRLETASDHVIRAERIVLATGFTDERPDPPLPRTGRGLHYCLHCDAYMFVDEPVYVMGHGDAAATVAMIMLNFTDEVDLLLRGKDPIWSDETERKLRVHPIDVIEDEIERKFSDEDDPSWLGGFVFEDGTRREYKGGFAMYGSDYNTELAVELGCDRNEDGTIAVDDHGRTSVDGVYAVGDVVPGHNQIPVAMGQGAAAGIAIHKELRTFPLSMTAVEAIEAGRLEGAPVPAMSERLRSQAQEHRAESDS